MRVVPLVWVELEDQEDSPEPEAQPQPAPSSTPEESSETTPALPSPMTTPQEMSRELQVLVVQELLEVTVALAWQESQAPPELSEESLTSEDSLVIITTEKY